MFFPNLTRSPSRFLYLLRPEKMTNRSCSSRENKNVIICSEKRIVGYSKEKMFSVVADVEKYHNFIPYCRKSTVTLKEDNRLSANLVVGFQPFFNISYTSHVTLVEPYLVTAVCRDVRIFDHLRTVWKFNPTKTDDPEACLIDFAVSFSFKSSSHSVVAKLFLDSIVKQNVAAFMDRAQAKYGPPSRESVQKSILVNKL